MDTSPDSSKHPHELHVNLYIFQQESGYVRLGEMLRTFFGIGQKTVYTLYDETLQGLRDLDPLVNRELPEYSTSSGEGCESSRSSILSYHTTGASGESSDMVQSPRPSLTWPESGKSIPTHHHLELTVSLCVVLQVVGAGKDSIHFELPCWMSMAVCVCVQL